jgi:hypothetical protein
VGSGPKNARVGGIGYGQSREEIKTIVYKWKWPEHAEESYSFKISLPCLFFIPASVNFFHLINYLSIFQILLGAVLKLRCCFKHGDAVLKL